MTLSKNTVAAADWEKDEEQAAHVLQRLADESAGSLFRSEMADLKSISRDDLYVYAITADEAPTRKWRRFGARGRFKPVLRRQSHLTVVLRERGS